MGIWFTGIQGSWYVVDITYLTRNWGVESVIVRGGETEDGDAAVAENLCLGRRSVDAE